MRHLHEKDAEHRFCKFFCTSLTTQYRKQTFHIHMLYFISALSCAKMFRCMMFGFIYISCKWSFRLVVPAYYCFIVFFICTCFGIL